MKIVKQYGVIILITGLMAAAVLYKSTSSNSFRYDASLRSLQAAGRSVEWTAEKVNSSAEDLLVINIDRAVSPVVNSNIRQLSVASDSVLTKPWKMTILGHKGIIILASDEEYKKAAVLMILSQIGKEDVYLLEN